jgi:uncharacterized protein (DUF58 family)
LKHLLSDIRPTTTSILLLQLSILLIVVGAVLHQYEYFVGAFAVIVYLAVVGARFHLQLLLIRPNLNVQRSLEGKRGHVGSACLMGLEISNGTELTVHIGRLEDVANLNESELRYVQAGRILEPKQKFSMRYEMRLGQAGVLVFGPVKLWVTDRRNLYQSPIVVEAPGRLEVGAPLLVSEMQLTPMQLYGGAPEQRRVGPAGTDYATTRAYVPGDEMRRIDWKATARLDKLMVREFHAEVTTPVIALLDVGPNMGQAGFVSSRLEEALAVAQLVGRTALDAGDPFGFGTFDRQELREHSLPELSRSRIEALRRIAVEAKMKPPRAILAEPRLAITSRTIRKRLAVLDLHLNDSRGLQKLAAFLGNARLMIRERFRKTGPYRALRTISDLIEQSALIIVLTDLQCDLEGLLEGVRYSRGRGHRAIIAQIAAPWRLEEDLEAAYVKYDSNRRIIEKLREEGALVLDTRPEQLLAAISKEITFAKVLGGLKE